MRHCKHKMSQNPKSKIQNPKSKIPFLLATAIAALALDQLSKAWVVGNVAGRPPISIIEGFARLRYTENTGAAFGFFQGWTGLLSIAAIGIIIAIVLSASRVGTSAYGMVALGLVTGGALGNLIDRLRLGHVTDFIDVYGPYLNINNVHYTFPVFNIADSAITIGAILLMATLLFGKDPAEATPKSPTPDGADTPEPHVSNPDRMAHPG